ncbi:SGNH hydrolase-type esterase domain-containing protein [Podospora aff. communis PSN243]|uniref:SGNH hydrolase-type esterase domain-containing protein n=1 Tax=Podospora aff. communis PSN243 TaxID=3040156 RepID=A0AAV9GX13_9PEZI|nr:SGNH hydrolase-type esterase domain-containing protein [Podospora aff. communis PSN243]
MTLTKIAGLLTLVGVGALAQREEIDSYRKDPNFVPYETPTQKVAEWIALGDSYTAGTGSNGDKEKVGVDAVRGMRSWAHQMSEDAGRWQEINGGGDLPRFTWTAYTGDRAQELRSQQLREGAFENRAWANRGRGIPFGKPQLAAMTIGGNDALLSIILNDCIYRAWLPGDCQKTIAHVKDLVTGPRFADTIAEAMFKVVRFGRDQGGAAPPQSFQLYVLPYIDFFNADDGNTACDTVDWRFWWFVDACPLTLTLRRQLNELSQLVNGVIKKEAENLVDMGVIYVGDVNPKYDKHRFCEPDRTNDKMVDAETWFWSRYSKVDTDDEGSAAAADDQAQRLLDFVLPGKGLRADALQRPPWEEPEAAQKFPDFESLLRASEDVNATETPFYMLRTFHPKGTAYTLHKDMFLDAIRANRNPAGGVGGGGAPMSTKCQDAKMLPQDIEFPKSSYRHHVGAACRAADGTMVKSTQDLNLCVGWSKAERKMVPHDEGLMGGDCVDCKIENNGLVCACRDPADPTGVMLDGSIGLDDFMKVRDDGLMECFGHLSARDG